MEMGAQHVKLKHILLFMSGIIVLLGNMTEALCFSKRHHHTRTMNSTKKNLSTSISIRGVDHHGIVTSIDNMLIDKKHKFLFCPIQKGGSSLWHQLFLRMQGDPHWWEPPWHKKLPTLRGAQLSASELSSIMHDDSWTKAVFFRDPSRRLLSAWKYCINKKEQVNQYRNHMTKVTGNSNHSWPAFCDSVISPLKHQNLHWRPQADFCGLHKFFPLYNFVGNLERSWLHGPALLRRVGIWEEYGAREWSLARVLKTPISAGKSPGRYNLKKMPKNFNTTDCMFCGNFAPHKSKYDPPDSGSSSSNITNSSLRRLSSTPGLEEVFLNKPNPPPLFLPDQHRSESHLTEDVWTSIRYSEYYARDYDVFSRIRVGPFERDLYGSYPPPLNAMS